MNFSAKQLTKHYQMQPHPEGGFYKETYRCEEHIRRDELPARFTGARSFSTAIYYLLQQGEFSAFHRIFSDECWHFYAGQTLEIYIIHFNDSLEIVKLGSDIENNEMFQFVVPAGCWFAAAPAENSLFSFTGCTVAPGFDFADFELAKRDELIKLYPQHEEVIIKFTRLHVN